MITQQKAQGWTKTAAAPGAGSRRSLRITSPFALADSVHPLIWLRSYPLLLPVVLLAVSGLMYMLQVNQRDNYDFTLSQLQATQTLNSGEYAHLAAQYDSLTSCAHVCTAAVTQYHMIHADLTQALWITVHLPPTLPRLPSEPRFHAGTENFMQQAWAAFRASL